MNSNSGNSFANKVGNAASRGVNSVRNLDKSTIISYLIIALVVLVAIYFIVMVVKDFKKNQASHPYLIDGTKSTSTELVIQPENIKPSVDGAYGMEFSYVFWIYVSDTTYAGNSQARGYKHIFHKGNSSGNPLQTPGVFLDPTENIMNINFNTFHSIRETCNVGNLPINKWFHVGIVVMGRNVDVYINGKLKKRCELKGIIRENLGPLYITKSGNTFDGYISYLQYFNYAVPFYHIEKSLRKGPSTSGCVDVAVMPPYFAPEWWFYTGFPEYDGGVDGSGNPNLGYTTPPAVNPPAGNPPAGNPPAGNPPAGNPPAGNPPAGNPPAGNPPAV